MSEEAAAPLESLCSKGLPLLRGALHEGAPYEPEFLDIMAAASCTALPGMAACQVGPASKCYWRPSNLTARCACNISQCLLYAGTLPTSPTPPLPPRGPTLTRPQDFVKVDLV